MTEVGQLPTSSSSVQLATKRTSTWRPGRVIQVFPVCAERRYDPHALGRQLTREEGQQ